jgi:LSD1 subclass zinc finger protein
MSDFSEATEAVNNELACSGCGAILKFKPGTNHLNCEYCGAKNEIASAIKGDVNENNLEEFLIKNFEAGPKLQLATVQCNGCGATSTLSANVSSDQCPFCASALVITGGTTAQILKPEYVLPFGLDENKALEHFRKWLKKLWFAPSELKHYGDRAGKLKGIYLPYWTFDARTQSRYSGQRGEHYWTTESYTAHENGKTVTRTRQVRRTNWYPASGSVSNVFDDVLVTATGSLPKNKLQALEPWDVKNLVQYNDKYLSGFRTEMYTVDLKSGFQEAKTRMEPVIRQTICNDIGGDEQQIDHVSTSYHNPTFKHILMPVYVSAYKYNNKVYQFIVNARTGEVQGQRPYSAGKIALAVIAGIIVIMLFFLMSSGN